MNTTAPTTAPATAEPAYCPLPPGGAAPGPHVQARCPRCGRRLGVLNSRRCGPYLVRYVGCRRQRGGCGHRPERNKQVVAQTYSKPGSL